MNVAEEIFEEYVQMRQNGLDANTVLNKLRPYIEPLSKSNKQMLARNLREWEGGNKDVAKGQASASGSSPSLGLKSLKGQTDVAPPPPDATWQTCSNCGEKSRLDAVFCWSCGQILEQAAASSKNATQHFSDSLGFKKTDYFGQDSVLVLRVRDFDTEFEVRPQQSKHEIFVGRTTENSTMTPDIDLSEVQGERYGVSRLHMSMKYDPGEQVIQIYDLGSMNGTFVNGQKLHPKELRVLRDGDELSVGRMNLLVFFHHPGDEIPS